MFEFNSGSRYVVMLQSVLVMPWHSTGLHCHTHYHS